MWLASYVIFTLGALLQGSATVLHSAAVRALLALFGIGLCFGIHLLLRHYARRRFRTRVIIASAAAPFAAEVFAWANFFAFQALHGRELRFVVRDWNEAVYALSLWTWFFIAWAGLYLAIEYSFDARHEAERSAELQGMAHTAKLRALSNQISPHFLFNSLNSISALILDGKSADAERMLAGLSSYFRSTLAIDPLIDVTLEEEFELHRRYLAIEQVRCPDLTVEIVLPDELRSAAIPALLIQPLVENAVKHGVATSPPPTHIHLAAERIDDALAISVVDTGNPTVRRQLSGSDGIGLANVRQRLAEYFGTMQALQLVPELGRFTARVVLPLAFR